MVWVRGGDTSTLREHVPLVDLTRFFRGAGDLRADYEHTESDYFLFDPTLGTRLRPNSRVVSLESNRDGTPRLATSRHLLVDQYGFISTKDEEIDTVDYARIANDTGVFRVVVSGGSTTAGWGASKNSATWPAELERLLSAHLKEIDAKFDRVAVFNTGVLGYNLSQEIRRFQEETVHLNPHLVICFNGINERWSYRGDPVTYTLQKPQRRIIRLLNYGPERRVWPILPYVSLLIADLAQSKISEPLYGYENTNYLDVDGLDLYFFKLGQFRAIFRRSTVAQRNFGGAQRPLFSTASRDDRPPNRSGKFNGYVRCTQHRSARRAGLIWAERRSANSRGDSLHV